MKVPDGRFLSKRVHRLAWVEANGPFPDGLVPHHKCENRLCYRADHLVLVTTRVNVLIGNGLAAANYAKTHCIRGHPLSGSNVYNPPKQPHIRHCKRCMQIRYRLKRLRRNLP